VDFISKLSKMKMLGIRSLWQGYILTFYLDISALLYYGYIPCLVKEIYIICLISGKVKKLDYNSTSIEELGYQIYQNPDKNKLS
jgi:hypothetical protein